MTQENIARDELSADVAHAQAPRRANRIPRIRCRDDFADTAPAPLADGIDIDAVHRRTGSRAWANAFPGCAGPCEQGRKLCPCPDACLADADKLATARGVVFAVGLTAACVAAALLLHWVLA